MGADPGPACYRGGGGEATVTDAHVVVGNLDPSHLLGGRKSIDRQAACEAVERNVGRPLDLDLDAAAHGILTIVNTNMVGALKLVSVEQGYDPRDFALVAFGGAGPLHATAVARQLQIKTVIIPESPGILCALGLLTVDRRFDVVRTAVISAGAVDVARLNDIWGELDHRAIRWLDQEGVAPDRRLLHRTVDARYKGQNYELTLTAPGGLWTPSSVAALEERFHQEHERIYSFQSRKAVVQFVNFRAVAQGVMPKPTMLPRPATSASLEDAQLGTRVVSWSPVLARTATPVYARTRLQPGHVVRGPAIIEQMDTTTLVGPGEHARVDGYLNLVVDLSAERV